MMGLMDGSLRIWLNSVLYPPNEDKSLVKGLWSTCPKSIMLTWRSINLVLPVQSTQLLLMALYHSEHSSGTVPGSLHQNQGGMWGVLALCSAQLHSAVFKDSGYVQQPLRLERNPLNFKCDALQLRRWPFAQTCSQASLWPRLFWLSYSVWRASFFFR